MRIPVATYRLQLHKDFGFRAVREIVPYLSDLGISDVYASPVFTARKGSVHGYDVVDPGALNPELGTLSEFEALAAEREKRGMGWLQDIVPNHMAFHPDNAMLRDVLENGSRSPYFDVFDIWWDHPYTGMQGRVLAPFLGRFFGESLQEGEIRLLYDEKGFSISYYDLLFPLKLESYLAVLTHGLKSLRRRLGGNHPDFIKLLGILYILRTLSSQQGEEEDHEQGAFVKQTLWEIAGRCEEIRSFVDENLRVFNGENDPADRVRRLGPLLSEQLFRLSFWKVATEEINYRRFFSINDLICVRVEQEAVFRRTHAFLIKLVEEGKLTGLRVDHIDGLFDPQGYLERLKEATGGAYVVTEKILDLDEDLPADWPVQGTSGYDYLNAVNGIFCRKGNERAMTRCYASFTGLRDAFEDLVGSKKKLILERHMTGDIDNLALRLKELSSEDRHGSDITLRGLQRALSAVMASFPVYRTYLRSREVREEDVTVVRTAVGKARRQNPGLRLELDFVERFLLLRFPADLPEEHRGRRLAFVMRFQQFTGPLMAKGFEDTVLYVYNRLLSLNEVGGDPGRFGLSLDRFHDYNRKRQARWPHALSATSTHDTKRGEDVRARIHVLSEIPVEWEGQIKAWARMNQKRKKRVGGVVAPDRNDEYFLYQTLLAAWPFDPEEMPGFATRMKEYAVKAVREAKVHTAWLKPDEEYEQACLSFLDGVLEPGSAFLEAFLPFQRKVAHCAVYTGLSQTLMKITCPGIPDFYQGCELWDLSLVDPDNRRPVDYARRRALLADILDKAGQDLGLLIRDLLSAKEDGRIKLYMIHTALKARREQDRLFREGDYVPLDAAGPFREHVAAYARRQEGIWALTVAPRFFVALAGGGNHPLGEEAWKDTALRLPDQAPEEWTNRLTGERLEGRGLIPIAEILSTFPVALLMNA